jgi:hypothetical protein
MLLLAGCTTPDYWGNKWADQCNALGLSAAATPDAYNRCIYAQYQQDSARGAAMWQGFDYSFNRRPVQTRCAPDGLGGMICRQN